MLIEALNLWLRLRRLISQSQAKLRLKDIFGTGSLTFHKKKRNCQLVSQLVSKSFSQKIWNSTCDGNTIVGTIVDE